MAPFTLGSVVGNISELGMSFGSTESLFSRALIKDVGGNPTTITLTASDQLIVTYYVTLKQEKDSFTGNFNLITNGVSSTISYEVRPDSIYSDYNSSLFFSVPNTSTVYLYSGFSFKDPAQNVNPGSSESTSVSATGGTYISNSFSRTISFTIPTGTANWAGGIDGFQIFSSSSGSYPRYQIKLTPAIMKTNTQTLSMSFTVNWARG